MILAIIIIKWLLLHVCTCTFKFYYVKLIIIILLYSGAVTAGSSPPVPHTVDFNDKVNFVKIEF